MEEVYTEDVLRLGSSKWRKFLLGRVLYQFLRYLLSFLICLSCFVPFGSFEWTFFDGVSSIFTLGLNI